MEPVRSYKAVGIAMLVIGIAFLAFGIFGASPTMRITGPVLAFMGLVLLSQAKKKRA